MTTVCILGAGELGGAIAQALAGREAARRLLLIDPAHARAAGTALDIQQAGAITGKDTRLAGTDDWSGLTGCAACVVADRATSSASPGWSGEEGRRLIDRLAAYSGEAPIVFAGATESALLLAAAQTGIARERLLGSAPHALAAAVTAIVAMEARCSPAEVMLTVLGGPAAGFVVPWSEASVGGHALDRVLTQAELARVEARAARLWPPGPYALGGAAARIIEALLHSSRRTFSVLAVLAGEFGVRNRVGIVPAQLWAGGIARTRVPVLTPREQVQVEIALGG